MQCFVSGFKDFCPGGPITHKQEIAMVCKALHGMWCLAALIHNEWMDWTGQ